MRRFAAMLALILLFGSSLVSFEPGRAENFVAGLDTFHTGNAEQARDLWMSLAEADNMAAQYRLAQAKPREEVTTFGKALEAVRGAIESLSGNAETADAEVARLGEELAAAKQEINRLKTSLAEAEAMRQATEMATARLDGLLAAARQEIVQVKTSLAEARAGLQAAKASLTKAGLRAPEAKEPIEASADVPGLANLPSAPGSPAPIEDPLIERGNALLALGDIASARLFYELALDNGNPQAATTIGQTYDPLYLKKLNVLGAPGKPEKALEWYRRAVEAGDTTAVERLKELTAWQAK